VVKGPAIRRWMEQHGVVYSLRPERCSAGEQESR
jgi:hypothetical protein